MNKENIIKVSVLFYFCSIFGYIYELILSLIYEGNLYSHGYLYGPWLPIYGVGAVLISLLKRYKDKPHIIFILSFFITGTWEYLIGLLLLKAFNMRLWDYKGYFLNIGGHVCFLSALCFAIGGLIVTYIIIPYLEKLIKKLNLRRTSLILIVLTIPFIIDIIASILK